MREEGGHNRDGGVGVDRHGDGGGGEGGRGGTTSKVTRVLFHW